MTENAEIVARATDKMLKIVVAAARQARHRMHDELTAEELEWLLSNPPAKMPPVGTIEHHLASALLYDGNGR